MISQTLTTRQGTTWTIDPSHSEATFQVRHAGVARVRGTVPIIEGTVKVGDSVEDSSVTATLDPAGIVSGSTDRDNHLRSPDFFDIETYPTWTFSSTSLTKQDDETFTMTGDLTLHGVTQPVTLKVEFAGTAMAGGEERAGFTATGEISRKDFGLTWNAPIEAGGLLVSDKVKLELDVAIVKN